MKKILAITLALTIAALTFASCGKKPAASTPQSQTTTSGSNEIEDVTFRTTDVDLPMVEKDENALYFGTHAGQGDVFGKESQKINPKKLYAGLEYDKYMFYGIYEVAEEIARKGATYTEHKTVKSLIGTEEYDVAPFPQKWCSSVPDTDGIISTVSLEKAFPDDNWVVLSYLTEKEIVKSICKYEIHGNKIKVYDVQTHGSGNEITYDLTGSSAEYGFEFSGSELILTAGGQEMHLANSAFYTGFNLEGYSFVDEKLVGKADAFNGLYSGNFATMRNGTPYDSADIKLCKNGLAYVKLIQADENGDLTTVNRQFAYFLPATTILGLQRAGLILIDEDNVYYYVDTRSDREAKINNGEDFSQDELDKINALYNRLSALFEEKGIGANIDRATGEVYLDATVLFGGDQAVLTAEGKAFLDTFYEAYWAVVFSPEYEGFVKSISIEGHTAPLDNSTYESGLPLSTQRAENVKAYLEGKSGMAVAPGTLQAVGLSNSRPIYNEDGEPDMAACRRVSFRFNVKAAK